MTDGQKQATAGGVAGAAVVALAAAQATATGGAGMDALAVYMAMAAIIIPFLVGLIARCNWPHWAKFGTLIVLSIAAGVGSVAASGLLDLSAAGWTQTILAIIGGGTVVYKLGIKSIPGLKEWLEARWAASTQA